MDVASMTSPSGLWIALFEASSLDSACRHLGFLEPEVKFGREGDTEPLVSRYQTTVSVLS